MKSVVFISLLFLAYVCAATIPVRDNVVDIAVKRDFVVQDQVISFEKRQEEDLSKRDFFSSFLTQFQSGISTWLGNFFGGFSSSGSVSVGHGSGSGSGSGSGTKPPSNPTTQAPPPSQPTTQAPPPSQPTDDCGDAPSGSSSSGGSSGGIGSEIVSWIESLWKRADEGFAPNERRGIDVTFEDVLNFEKRQAESLSKRNFFSSFLTQFQTGINTWLGNFFGGFSSSGSVSVGHGSGSGSGSGSGTKPPSTPTTQAPPPSQPTTQAPPPSQPTDDCGDAPSGSGSSGGSSGGIGSQLVSWLESLWKRADEQLSPNERRGILVSYEDVLAFEKRQYK